MIDRNERIHDAFHDEANPVSWNRDRVLSRILQHTQGVRRRRTLFRFGIVLVALCVAAALWMTMRLRAPGSAVLSPIPTLDSIPTNSAEVAVSNQEPERATLLQPPSQANLLPLLGHRSQLSMELQNLTTKREEFRVALNANPSPERTTELRTIISGLDGDIAATRTALRVVDRQLAGIQGGEAAIAIAPDLTHEGVTITEVPPIHIGPTFPPDTNFIAGGLAVAVILTMGAFVLYLRRTMRATVDALSSLQGQASNQLAALTAGIEAIAIEVERLGENQRFMSKVIAGDAKEGAELRGKA